ncbi:MAG: hypothetical protein FWD63_07665, partial [Propionibacteriaceae bacterium]|nr:hypothetical protein [Propionibacteriaceae bacterium]
GLVTMVVVPLAQATLLSVAYVRLHQVDEMAFARPVRLGWKPALAVVVSLAVAVGISVVKPGDADPIRPITLGTPVTLMTNQVNIDDLRVGQALAGDGFGSADAQPVPSVGVFVAVNVTVSGRDRSSMDIWAETGGLMYPPWDSAGSIVGAPPGFRTTCDVVFEVPADSLADLSIFFQPVQPLPTTLPIGVFTVPPGTVIDPVITVDETQVIGVM